MTNEIAIRLVLAAATGLALVANSPQTAFAQTVLKFAWQLPLTNYASKGSERVAQCIQEKSSGAVKVETFPAGQLYRARQLYEASRTGAVDIAMFALGSFATTDPMVDMVYCRSWRPPIAMFEALHGELGAFVDQVAGKANVRVLAYFAGSGGQFGNRTRALRKPDDFKGLKIRVPGAIAAEVVKAFGGVPATVDASEVYLALQRGTVDGTNFPLTSFYDRKLYETVGHLTIANVSFDPDVVVISSRTWSRLTPDQQAMLKVCASDGEQWVRGEEQRLSTNTSACSRTRAWLSSNSLRKNALHSRALPVPLCVISWRSTAHRQRSLLTDHERSIRGAKRVIRFPTAVNVAADSCPCFEKGLRASKVSADEAVIIYADTLTNPQYPAAFLGAAKDLGAHAFQIIQPAVPRDLKKPMGRAKPTALIGEAMKQADFVLDISTGGMLYSDEQTAILASGTLASCEYASRTIASIDCFRVRRYELARSGGESVSPSPGICALHRRTGPT